MSQGDWLRVAFMVGAFLWVAANAFYTPRYFRALRHVRDPRSAPFILGLVILGMENLANAAYYVWILFFPPDSLQIRQWAVFVIPFDYAFGACAYIVVNLFVERDIRRRREDSLIR